MAKDNRSENKSFRANLNAPNIVGIVIENNGKLQVRPCNKKTRLTLYDLRPENLNGASTGDVVVLEPLPYSSVSPNQAKVKRILGQKNTPGILSLISLCEKGLSETFSEAALKETKGMSVPGLEGREDLRNIPLVTIDGADTRDIDDAVFAEKTADGGFHLIVAIADVSWYVRPGSDLDKEAYARGNSTYFPDRVLPMLPESLSNGLCSLNPHEDRACMACHMWIDKDGNLLKQKVGRGLMNSAARLTYAQVQSAKDGKPDAVTTPLMDNVINPLYEAYAALRQARERRGALDFDMPENKITVDSKAEISVGERSRRDSDKLIEEFMILANVATPRALAEKGASGIYRVHSAPPYADSMNSLREYIGKFDLTLPEEIKDASAFNDVIEKAAKLPNGPAIVKAIMRVQAKAKYDTNNIGHFGLALTEYTHFTSPIRRYADLLEHRALVDAFNMGAGGLDSDQKTRLTEMAEHISNTENLSKKAERSANDRLVAAFLSAHVGKQFKGKIVSVTSAGAFVRLNHSGADGLMPMRNLPNDFYVLDAQNQTLTGRRAGRVYRTGDNVTVHVKEADGLSGSIIFSAANDNTKQARPQHKRNAPKP